MQALGRCSRISSLSETLQELIFYRGTIEEAIAAIVSRKLKCLRQAVGKKEEWKDMLFERKWERQPVETEWIENENVNVDEEDEEEDE